MILPKQIDNNYNGYKFALWLLGIIVTMKIAQSVSVFVSGPFVVTGADGIPLQSLPSNAAQTIVAMFAISALSRLILALLCVLVLVRYRKATALMFGLQVIDYLGKQTILYFIPIERTGEPVGPTVNFLLFILTIAGLILSVLNRRKGH
jgi:hypothetical protein